MTVKVRVRVTNDWWKRLLPSTRRAERELAALVAEDARRYVGVRTGRLRSTIRAVGNRVYVGTDYWHYHHFGTRPHIILPRRKKALYWPGADHPVARVRHPGTKANPFLTRALYQRRVLDTSRW